MTKNARLTPTLRVVLDDLVTVHREMIAALNHGVSEEADEIVERFDAATAAVIRHAEFAGFGRKRT